MDFIGQAHQNYNFEEKFRALLGKTKHSVRHYVENGFFNLPKGCFIQLEKQVQEYVLRNIKDTANTRANLITKLKFFQEDTGFELTLQNFLNQYHLSLHDFYGQNRNRSFTRLLVEAGLKEDFNNEDESFITKKLPNLFHLNSNTFLRFLLAYMEGSTTINNEEEQLMLAMFYYTFYKSHPEKEGFSSITEGVKKIIKNVHFKNEILSILRYQYVAIETLEFEPDLSFPCPLRVHSKYSTAQVLSALGYFNAESSPSFREGVKYFKDKKLDIFFITLNKSEKDFSPSTLYEDYAINERLFHWQTQSKVSEGSETARRYLNHKKTGNKIALFVREYKSENGYTASFVFLGTCEYVSHSGNKPMSFIWRLKEEIPSYLVPKANKNIL